MPETGKTDGQWEGWRSPAVHSAGSLAALGGWQPSWSRVKVVKWCLLYLAATPTVLLVPPGEDIGDYAPQNAQAFNFTSGG